MSSPRRGHATGSIQRLFTIAARGDKLYGAAVASLTKSRQGKPI